jgi:hypothetical protein
MSILKFLKGSKGSIKHGDNDTQDNEAGTLYLADNTTTDKKTDNAYLYYSDGKRRKNVVPEFIESQSDSEIVITFNS